jgi:hypothetical protein
VNNADSTSGMCVRTDEIPASGALQEQAAFRCPIPCNPTWDSGDIAMVCGADRVCCQTVELGPNDCITVDGVRRPVTGADAPQYTQWRGAEHDTHQNPTGKICEKYGAANSTTWRDCVDQLSVANQRGFCMQLDEGQQCPAETIADPCAGAAEGGA